MSGRRDMRRAARAGLVVAATVASVTAATPLSAEPINPVIVGDSAGLGAGAATIGSVSNGPGMDVTVDQHAERFFIDWQSFNIGASDSVNFQQGGSQWIAVNRVTGGLGPTTIEGMLTADGHVWIIDPAGIAFSSDAVVDVGGLLATASNIDPGDFLAVTDLEDAAGFTFASGGNGTAQVSNAGTINSGGLLALVAPIVDNSGTLESTYGDVLLGGANAFRLSFTQVERPADADHPVAFDELLVTDFIIETPVTNDPVPGNETVPVTNTGNLTGANVIVSAASAGGGAFINMDGVVEATSIGDRSGDVVILGGGDFTGGAADAGSGATEAIRIDNADISAAADFEVQGTSVSIEKGTGPGTLTAGAIRIAATGGDATSDVDLTSTSGGIDISATGLVSVSALDAATTIDIAAADVDLDTALRLLTLPREVGIHPETGKKITAGLGRFGPFVLHDGTYANLKDPEELVDIGLNRAITVLAEKVARAEERAGKVLKELGEHPDSGKPVQLREGKYGPYIKHGSTNATLPKSAAPEDVTLEEALVLVAEKEAKTGKGKKKAPAKKKEAAEKKPAAKKKAPAKKSAAKTPAAKKKAAPKKAATKKTPASKTGKATEMAD